MNFLEFKKKYFNSTEEIVSMFLGLVIVAVVGGLIFNYFQKSKGTISVPGTTDIVLNGDAKVISESKDNTYVVVKGDNLWKIAADKYNNGYAWTEIAKANNIKNPSTIEVGQKLIMPKVEVKEVIVKTVEPKNDQVLLTGEYKVTRGDSLWKISVKVYGDGYQWTKIWQENKSKLNNPNNLEIGMSLTLPKLK